MKSNGKIKVNSENILPVIKKWLYSDRDIFLRELVSNACDAITKLKKLRAYGEAEETQEFSKIDIVVDKANATISISDNGIGMTEEEIKMYINQIAFSGAEEFMKKYAGQENAANGIIGHFGLGFYSAFIVSERVEIETLSYTESAEPVHWSCDGGSEYKIKNGSRNNIGTTVMIHIDNENKDFLEITKIRELLLKYCSFMLYPIFVHNEKEKSGKAINDTDPLWNKEPKSCTDQEYKEFYKKTFNDYNEPLFWLHLNVSHPFVLKGILYFPKQNKMIEPFRGKVALYSSQVFVAENVKEIIPEFMFLLKGIIDCPEMPLNVSRSSLQNDKTLKQISSHIIKKVADKLIQIFNDDIEKYNENWEEIGPFIKYGCIRDEKFYEKVKDILIVKTINGDYISLFEYAKTNKTVYYVTDEKIQAGYIKIFKTNDQNAVLLNHDIDKHFISYLEYKQKDFKFMRIDSVLSDEMREKDLTDYTPLISKFKKAVGNENLDVKTAKFKDHTIPAIIIQPEEERRLNEMQEMYNSISIAGGNLKESVVLNTANSTVKNIIYLKKADREFVCHLIYDMAKVNHRQLSPDEMEIFTSRMSEMLGIHTNAVKSDTEISDVEIIL